MLRLMASLVVFQMVLAACPGQAARFDISDHGATPDDQSDDTAAVLKTLAACAAAGGGEVFVPAGTWLISRQGAESPILGLPSNTVLCGEGPSSILKFDPKVNQSNYWRMLGAADGDCRNITIRDLRLDGSTTFTSYKPGETPEHNHGIFLYHKEHVIENVTIRDCFIENFAGDCIGLGPGCRNITIRDVTVRNFVRQGIQMAGGNGARDYLVTGCQDLEGDVQPGGSTIHVEHARGLKNVIISDNRCRNSLLAGGVDGIIIRGNVIAGRLEGNGNSNALVQGNLIRGGQSKRAVVQFGYANGLIFRGNIVRSETEEAGGLYVWGTSRYNAEPSRDLSITGNTFRVQGQPIFLNGVRDGVIRDNLVGDADPAEAVRVQRAEGIDHAP